MVALPGPPGKKGEPGPPGFGLPGKHVSSGARGGGMLAGYVERGAGAAWITRLPSQWGADGSVKRGWCLCPQRELGHSMVRCAERTPPWG